MIHVRGLYGDYIVTLYYFPGKRDTTRSSRYVTVHAIISTKIRPEIKRQKNNKSLLFVPTILYLFFRLLYFFTLQKSKIKTTCASPSFDKALKENRKVSIGNNLTISQINVEEEKKKEEEGKDDTNTSNTAAPGNKDKDQTNSADGKEKGGKPQNNQATITSQYRQAVEQCNSTLPIHISAAFNMLQARVELINKSTVKDKHNTKISWYVMYQHTYIPT